MGIALVTKEPRFYYKAIKELKDRDIDFIVIDDIENIPEEVSVILTSKKEEKRFKKIKKDKKIVSNIEEAIRIANGLKSRFKELLIGIDPGLKPGIAFIGDGLVVRVARVYSPEEIKQEIKNFLKNYSADRIVFKVGNGGGVYRDRILKTLQENFKYDIEIICEKSTTPSISKEFNRATKDIIAAINIALKVGRIIKEKIEPIPNNGEIRKIQTMSREISGKITISRDLAKKVAVGELSIEEAIEIHKKRKNLKRGK